jgi:hypothetical protein
MVFGHGFEDALGEWALFAAICTLSVGGFVAVFIREDSENEPHSSLPVRDA